MDIGSLPGVKQPKRGADHQFPAKAKVANGLELLSPPPLCARIGMAWGDFYLYPFDRSPGQSQS